MTGETKPATLTEVPGEQPGRGSASQPPTISKYLSKLQRTVQLFLAAGPAVLREVEENVFSTCPEPVDSLAVRMVRARELMIPLVEVALFPADYADLDVLRRSSGLVGNKVVSAVAHSDGLERTTSLTGKKFLSLSMLSVSVVGLHILPIGGQDPLEISSVISEAHIDYDVDATGRIIGDPVTQFGFSGSDYNEGSSKTPDFPQRADRLLTSMLVSFARAMRLEQAYAVVNEPPSTITAPNAQ